jgi:hypothetical protein
MSFAVAHVRHPKPQKNPRKTLAASDPERKIFRSIQGKRVVARM